MSAEQPTAETLQREAAALRARVAELEQRERELQVFRKLADVAPDAIVTYDLQGVVLYANAAAQDLFGYGNRLIGMAGQELLVASREELAEIWAPLEHGASLKVELAYRRQDGSTFPAEASISVIEVADGRPQGVSAIIRDLSEQRRAEEERATLQEQVIDAQRAALREVSTPLIPLAEDVVVMPLVGAIDSARAQQIMEVLLEGIAHYQADTVLVDISGVRVVDTQVADALLRAARAVQLLGAQIILTGISADVAQTIVHLGADMGRIMTRANLQDGLRYALEERAR